MNEHIEFRHEGQTLEELNKSKNQPGSSEGEKKKEDGAGSGEGGGAGAPADKKPFGEDPEVQDYIARQVAKSVEAVQSQHKTEMESLRQEIAAGRKPDVTAEKRPRWFGGNDEQWAEFQDWFKQGTAAAGEGVMKTLSEGQKQQETLTQQATEFFQSELAAISADKALNPKGLKVDPEALLKVALEYELIDTKQRWNYRAAWRILRPQLEAALAAKAAKDAADPNRKNMAGASVNRGAGGEPTAKPYKTSEDFRKKRPW